MSLDAHKRAEYITKLNQSKPRVMVSQQLAYRARPGAPGSVVTTRTAGPVPVPGPGTSHIIVQSQMPAGLTQQEQLLWLQQQGTRQVVVRAGGAPGLSPISQQQQQQPVPAPQQQQQQPFNPNDPNQQMLLQRQQLRVQQIPMQQTGAPQQQQQQQQQMGKQTVQLISGQIIEQQTIVQQPSTPGTPTTPGATVVVGGGPVGGNIMTQALVMSTAGKE